MSTHTHSHTFIPVHAMSEPTKNHINDCLILLLSKSLRTLDIFLLLSKERVKKVNKLFIWKSDDSSANKKGNGTLHKKNY